MASLPYLDCFRSHILAGELVLEIEAAPRRAILQAVLEGVHIHAAGVLQQLHHHVAAALEDLKRSIESIDNELAELAEESSSANHQTIARLEARKSRLIERVATEQKQLQEAELKDKRWLA